MVDGGSKRIVDLCGTNKKIATNGVVKKSVTFAAATTGAQASKRLFTVTGKVLIAVIPLCTTDLTSGGAATIAMGTVSSGAALARAQGFEDLNDGTIWIDNDVDSEVLHSGLIWVMTSENVTYVVADATVTGGVVDFYAIWSPLSEGASVSAAGVNQATT